MRRIFKFVALSLLLAFQVHANELIGGRAKALATSTLSADNLALHQKACDDIGMMTMVRKKTCLEAVQLNKLSDVTYEFCAQKELTERLDCLSDSAGRDYPVEYLRLCDHVQATKYPQRKKCLDYLAQSNSTFDPDIFSLCVRRTGSDFNAAKPCLNAIRDRSVNTQKILAECTKADGIASDAVGPCVQEQTDRAPLSPYCQSPTEGKPRAASPANQGSR